MMVSTAEVILAALSVTTEQTLFKIFQLFQIFVNASAILTGVWAWVILTVSMITEFNSHVGEMR